MPDRAPAATLYDAFDFFRVGDCETHPRQLTAGSTGATATGTIYAARARVRESGTFTQIRFCTGTTGPTSITDLRCGIWKMDDTLLATTANESANVTTANTVYTLALTTPQALNAGDEVYLGIGQVGTTPTLLRGISSISALNVVPPNISRSASSWAGGALPALTAGTLQIPWMCLL